MRDSLIENVSNKNNLTNIYKKCKIIRDKFTKSASLEINIPGEWSLFAGNSIEKLDFKKLVIQGKDRGIYPLPTPVFQRNYFKLITEYGSAVLAEKHLPMEGGYNFRDLGGIQSQNGNYVQWGKIFRSDDLFNLTQKDSEYLSGIPIITIVDFRCQEEYSQLPNKFPESLRNYYNLSIDPGSIRTFSRNKITSKEKVIEAMKNLYRLFVTEPEYVSTYREFFRLIQDESKLPLLFHCSAGKDRTGLAAALLLSALDIPKEIIIQDYMDSNVYLSDKYTSLFEQNPVNKYLYTALPEYLETAWNEIEKKYGSLSVFLDKEMKINREKFKELFLF